MGIKHRQSEIMAMLFSEDELKDKDYENYNGLKIQEKQIEVADFLIWKSKKILNKEDTSFNDKTLAPLEKMILNLKNKDEVTCANYKELLKKVVPDSKIRRKIFTLIKKYQGQYEDNLRTVICLNNERKTLAKKKRDATIATLTGALDKLFLSDKKKQGIVEREKKRFPYISRGLVSQLFNWRLKFQSSKYSIYSSG